MFDLQGIEKKSTRAPSLPYLIAGLENVCDEIYFPVVFLVARYVTNALTLIGKDV